MSTNQNDVGNQIKKDGATKQKSSFQFLPLTQYDLLRNPYVEGVIRVFGTSVAVATILHPMDVLMTRFRSQGYAPMMANHQFFSKLFTGFLTTQKQAALKNMVIANKEKVNDHVGEMIGEQENKAFKKYSEMLVTTVIVGGIDTIFTQYFANKRILDALGDKIELSLGQKFQFAKEGMLTRGGRNFVTTLACIGATTTVSEFINPLIPKDQVFAHTAATSVISGFAISPFASVLDNVYQEKIRQVNKSTLKTPPITEMFVHLWQQGGVRRLVRGAGMGGLYNMVAFGVINGVAEFMNSHLFPRQPTSSVSQQGSFFTPAIKNEPKAIAPAIEETGNESPTPSKPK
ncbi:hypothetical protein Lrub_2269 [Legionella rubrilucens]|uniref:Periplasmic ligand-binding sensor domain protein n=1 Tax=Legionella rubrilucens TaxID=458 RepID=A0A0W0XSQ7_9GAMM|nr:hypothetical protein [Legionella rubrilucens]KTD47347.1 hypothetical protein Lrub_2269 [Legionella rubrilucens]